jgi:galactokinase
MQPPSHPISYDSADVRDFVAMIDSLGQHSDPLLRNFLAADRPTVIARAPGRLDVMGGIADYSGSLVLQMPIAEATCVATQRCADGQLRVVSSSADAAIPTRTFAMPCRHFRGLAEADDANARDYFARVADAPTATHPPAAEKLAAAADDDAERNAPSHWAAYVVGVMLVLARARQMSIGAGLRVLIRSDVPEGSGVSSSAALEVATLRSVAGLLLSDAIPGEELAQLCQTAENHLVGAPCGIMDQMTAALGRAGHLLSLLCQPAVVVGLLPVPESIRFWGIDSRVRHAVGGAAYGRVRTAAASGYRILANLAGLEAAPANAQGVVTLEDPLWHGYLANVGPTQWAARYAQRVPVTITGAELLERYGGTADPVAHIDPDVAYPVRAATAHPIDEHPRIERFAELLQSDLGEPTLRAMGNLMYAAHASYTACGLGCDATDLLVELVRRQGPAAGLFGARITGGGSGGTVAILGRKDSAGAVAAVAEGYRQATGRTPRVFTGSSMGACEFGLVRRN